METLDAFLFNSLLSLCCTCSGLQSQAKIQSSLPPFSNWSLYSASPGVKRLGFTKFAMKFCSSLQCWRMSLCWLLRQEPSQALSKTGLSCSSAPHASRQSDTGSLHCLSGAPFWLSCSWTALDYPRPCWWTWRCATLRVAGALPALSPMTRLRLRLLSRLVGDRSRPAKRSLQSTLTELPLSCFFLSRAP